MIRPARIAAASLLCFAASTALAQAPAAPAKAKSIVKTSCQEYMALDETIKPKFIYYAVGHSKKGQPEAVFDEVAVEKIRPELDKYCTVNLTKSAYDKVMAESIASERAARGAHAK